MANVRPVSPLRLILWPTLVTLGINLARITLEVQGVVPPATGGALHPLGITWLGVLFGAWFGWRLRRSGDGPALRPAPLWTLLGLAAVVGAVAWQFGGIDRGDQSDAMFEILRSAVLTIAAVTLAAAAVAFVVWPRLAWTLLLYALPARATVLGLTWLAKQQGWDTHYTKFGPSAIERDMASTMVSATIAQMGFWIAFTVVSGSLAGAVAAHLTRPRTA